MPDKPWLEKFEQLDIHAAPGQLVNSGVLDHLAPIMDPHRLLLSWPSLGPEAAFDFHLSITSSSKSVSLSIVTV